MPAIQKRRWTAAEVRRLIDESPEPTPRFELVRGELLVTPSPNRMHQRIVQELYVRLRSYVRQHRLGEVFASPSDIYLAPEFVAQPDLYVVPAIGGLRAPSTDRVTRVLLAVEVLSPSSARFDRVDKRRAYQECGVPEYWIVDPDAKVFERWRPSDERPEILDRELVWRPTGDVEPFMLNVAAFFAEVAD